MQAVAKHAGPGTHHVYSIVDRTTRSYRVAGSNMALEARSIPTPRDVTLCVNGLSELHISSNGTMRVTIPVPFASLSMGWDAGREPHIPMKDAAPTDASIEARLAAGDIPSATAEVNALLRCATSLAGFRQGALITWDVSFADSRSIAYDEFVGDSFVRRRDGNRSGE